MHVDVSGGSKYIYEVQGIILPILMKNRGSEESRPVGLYHPIALVISGPAAVTLDAYQAQEQRRVSGR